MQYFKVNINIRVNSRVFERVYHFEFPAIFFKLYLIIDFFWEFEIESLKINIIIKIMILTLK